MTGAEIHLLRNVYEMELKCIYHIGLPIFMTVKIVIIFFNVTTGKSIFVWITYIS